MRSKPIILQLVPTSYRENRAYKKNQLNSPTQEKRIQKQAKKKNTCFTIQ
jgi:hypothetical protein